MEHILNPLYLKKDSIEQLQKSWKNEPKFPHIMLTKVLSTSFYKEKEKEVKKLVYKREVRPDSFSYAKAKANSLHILDQKELHEFLSTILNKKVSGIIGEAYYFSWKDYTLLSRKTEEKQGIDVILDFTPNWKEEYGGSIIYKENTGRYLKFIATPNTLILIERKNTQKYIQYVNNLSKGKKRYFLIGKIR